MATNGTNGTTDSTSPTKEQWDELCGTVKGALMKEMGDETWYLIIVSGT